jgi:hypothetical protein
MDKGATASDAASDAPVFARDHARRFEHRPCCRCRGLEPAEPGAGSLQPCRPGSRACGDPSSRRPRLGLVWGRAKARPAVSYQLPGYEPRQTDLVLTGAAEALFQRGGLILQSDAQVLKTRAMVAKDWRRSVTDPRALPCLRYLFTKQFPSNWRLVSFRRIAFPRLARYSAAYRMLIRVRAQGRSIRIVLDQVFVGRSRTELTLTGSAPAAARATISAAEVRAARVLTHPRARVDSPACERTSPAAGWSG